MRSRGAPTFAIIRVSNNGRGLRAIAIPSDDVSSCALVAAVPRSSTEPIVSSDVVPSDAPAKKSWLGVRDGSTRGQQRAVCGVRSLARATRRSRWAVRLRTLHRAPFTAHPSPRTLHLALLTAHSSPRTWPGRRRVAWRQPHNGAAPVHQPVVRVLGRC